MSENMDKFPIIVIEGPDGAGKGSMINLVLEYIKSKDIEYVLTREPGGTRIGEMIRELLLDSRNTDICDITEAYGYAMSRVQHVFEKLIPEYESGKLVICDRFALSSICYQGYGRGFDVELIKKINETAMTAMADKMINIVLLVDSETGIMRKKGQQELDRLELAGKEFHQRVNDGYCTEVTKNEYGNYYPIDANGTIEETFAQVLELLKQFGI